MSESDSDLSFDSEEEEQELDSDEELQEAFQKGELKPGLNVIERAPKKKRLVYNVAGLKQKLIELKVDLDWGERLDLSTSVDDIMSQSDDPKLPKDTVKDELVNNDLQLELLLYKQAQTAALEGLAKLKASDIPTKRPTDYFAQMAKTDEHMLKVKRSVLAKQLGQERAHKVKKMRELKKYGKQVQVEVALKRAKEKRETLDKIKQYREGKLQSLDFLDNDHQKGEDILEVTKRKTKERNASKGVMAKRQKKDSKFGFGGKKSGMKKNNMRKEEAGPAGNKRGQKFGGGDKKFGGRQKFGGGGGERKFGGGGGDKKFGGGGGERKFGGNKQKPNRPGKSRRQATKNKKR
uniref:EOG090X0D84 n=1 Tax=Lynceus sp. MCZ IZ 141354 TaxID=1930659 RepID=A0A9N6ZG14_9CRUS|nr:EOG090X0D84 [Lynceus sp. MCZ IZ 141354]